MHVQVCATILLSLTIDKMYSCYTANHKIQKKKDREVNGSYQRDSETGHQYLQDKILINDICKTSLRTSTIISL